MEREAVDFGAELAGDEGRFPSGARADAQHRAAGTTVSAATGFEVDVFGLIKAGRKAEIAKTLTTTQLETTQVSYVSGYTGSASADTTVFQGTLNQTHEYRIVSALDADAVGQLVTITVPVDSLTYNWTLDYFNSYMAPEDRIGDDVLGHTPGQIQSYPTFHELNEAVSGSLHWQHPTERDVGQGAGSNDLEIAFLDENATQTQRTVSVEVEGSVGIGVEVSGAESSESGSSYAITYSETSRFTTTVDRGRLGVRGLALRVGPRGRDPQEDCGRRERPDGLPLRTPTLPAGPLLGGPRGERLLMRSRAHR